MQSAKRGSSQAEAELWFLGLEAASSPGQGRVGAAGEGAPHCIAPLGQGLPNKLGPRCERGKEGLFLFCIKKK